MKHCVSEIFAERPKRWGLRGDPFLWERLEKRYDTVAAPYPSEELRRGIMQELERLFGKAPSAGAFCFVPEFAKKHVGMSTGGISADFWLDTAIPLLVRRLERLNRQATGNTHT